MNWALDQESHSHLGSSCPNCISQPAGLWDPHTDLVRLSWASQIKASSGAHLPQKKEMTFTVFKLVNLTENKGGTTHQSVLEVTVQQCSVFRTLVLSVDWVQDQSQLLPKPVHGYNSTGRDGSVNSQRSGSAAGPKHSCHPATHLPTKRGTAIPCFQLALLINHWGGGGGGNRGKAVSLKCRNPTSQAYFLVLFVGVTIRRTILPLLSHRMYSWYSCYRFRCKGNYCTLFSFSSQD